MHCLRAVASLLCVMCSCGGVRVLGVQAYLAYNKTQLRRGFGVSVLGVQGNLAYQKTHHPCALP